MYTMFVYYHGAYETAAVIVLFRDENKCEGFEAEAFKKKGNELTVYKCINARWHNT